MDDAMQDQIDALAERLLTERRAHLDSLLNDQLVSLCWALKDDLRQHYQHEALEQYGDTFWMTLAEQIVVRLLHP